MSQLELPTSFAVRESRERVGAFGEGDVTVVTRRLVAGVIDWVIQVVLMVAFARTFGITAIHEVVSFGVPQGYSFIPHHFVFEVWYPHLLPLLAYAAVCLAYFTGFEAVFGWTLGKLLVGICVVDFFGRKPSLLQSVTRNAFRLLDGYPYVIPNLTGLAILASNRRRQRGGDKAAGTLVVDRRTYTLVRDQLKQSRPKGGRGHRVSDETPAVEGPAHASQNFMEEDGGILRRRARGVAQSEEATASRSEPLKPRRKLKVQ